MPVDQNRPKSDSAARVRGALKAVAKEGGVRFLVRLAIRLGRFMFKAWIESGGADFLPFF